MAMKGVRGGERGLEMTELGHFNLKSKVESHPEQGSVGVSPTPPDSEASGSQASVTFELPSLLPVTWSPW